MRPPPALNSYKKKPALIRVKNDVNISYAIAVVLILWSIKIVSYLVQASTPLENNLTNLLSTLLQDNASSTVIPLINALNFCIRDVFNVS